MFVDSRSIRREKREGFGSPEKNIAVVILVDTGGSLMDGHEIPHHDIFHPPNTVHSEWSPKGVVEESMRDEGRILRHQAPTQESRSGPVGGSNAAHGNEYGMRDVAILTKTRRGDRPVGMCLAPEIIHRSPILAVFAYFRVMLNLFTPSVGFASCQHSASTGILKRVQDDNSKDMRWHEWARFESTRTLNTYAGRPCPVLRPTQFQRGSRPAFIRSKAVSTRWAAST